MIFNCDGGLIASLDWETARQIYGAVRAANFLAVYVTRRGRHQVKHLCTGLEATAQENREELAKLEAKRKALGRPGLPR